MVPRQHGRTAQHPWVDGASLAAFRVLFGGVMVAQTLRFWAKGWVETQWVQPRFHFTWPLFDWVQPLSAPAMKALLALQLLAALGVTLGYRTRASAALLALLFTAGELIDKALYLNHYYLVSLLAVLCAALPVSAVYSLDARRRPRGPYVRRLALTTLRAQVACVYVFAGLAKLNGDWLLRGEPLATWLQAHQGLPWGPLLDSPSAALAMSWAGLLHDLLIVPALLWGRTRRPAFAAALLFHGGISLLFPVGVFSWVMLAALTSCLAPDWPRRLVHRVRRQRAPAHETTLCAPARPAPAGGWRRALAALWITAQVLIPLRFLAYPGDVNWTEQGFRFAWRVMLVEKTGAVEFEVTTRSPPGRFREARFDELTPLQRQMMSVQADLIHDYAYHLAQRYEARGYAGVSVRADAWVAWNGRPAARLIDPAADLLTTSRGAAPQPWLLPAP